MPLISAIIPVYKVAPFVERCVRSLMEQTLDDVEFIFVDDASPDGSMDIVRGIVAQYPERNVKFALHESNMGLPAARNTGLEQAHGEYVYHCDSDDYLEPDMLERMYRTAVEMGADYVYCDFFLDFGTSCRCMRTPEYGSAEQMIKEGFLAGQMKYNVWNKLVHHSLYEAEPAVRFPTGHGMGEDMTMIALALHSNKVARVPAALYHYMKTNTGAFTSSFSARHLVDIDYNVNRTLAYLQDWDVPDKERFVAYFKLGVKLPFLMTGKFGQYRLWQRWYSDANRFISGNPYLPMRTRALQIAARYHLFPLVWLYAFIVNDIYYGGWRARAK